MMTERSSTFSSDYPSSRRYTISKAKFTKISAEINFSQ